MNNIEQIIVRLKTRVALAELIGPNEMIVSASDLSALIAQLEAAHGSIKELESKVNHYVAAEYAHKHFDQTAEIIKRADSAELELVKVKAELSAANEKPKPISFDELADAVKHVTGGIRIEFDPKFDKGHQAVPFMNFNSLSRIVEMYRSTETYHLAGFKVEGE